MGQRKHGAEHAEPFFGETGARSERIFFGALDTQSDRYKELLVEAVKKQKEREAEEGRTVPKHWENVPPYLDDDLAFDLARGYQVIVGGENKVAIDPSEPDGNLQPFLSEVRIALLDELAFDDSRLEDEVNVYTAASYSTREVDKTPADYHAGVDGFIDIPVAGLRDTYVTVTFDITLKEKDVVKADIVIGKLPDPRTEIDAFLEEVDTIAARVAALYRKRKGEALPRYRKYT